MSSGLAKRIIRGMATRGPTTEQRLEIYATRRRQLINETAEVREKLADAIRAADAEGMRQVDIVRITGYTREQIRNIVAGRTR